MTQKRKGLLKYFFSYYRPHRSLFALDMVTAMALSFFTIVIPFIVVRLLGKTKLEQASPGEIWASIGLMTILIALMSVCSYVNTRWGHYLGAKIEADMRADLFRHLQKMSFSYFDNTKTGHIMSRISNDLSTISELAHHGPEDFVISILMITGSLGFMFWMNWRMAIIVAIPLPIIVTWGGIFRLRLKHAARDVRKKVADINSNVENAIQGIREVKSYAKEDYAVDKFDSANEAFRDAKTAMYSTMAAFHSGIMFLMEFYSVIIIGGGIFLVYAKQLELVEMIGFLMYRRYMFQPVRRLVSFVEQYQLGTAAFERFIEIMEIAPDIQDRPDAQPLDTLEGDVRLEHVSFKYDQTKDSWVLDNVNMHVAPGTTVALVGESGAGKSTVAALIPRFYEPQKGRVLMDGKDIMALKRRDLRRLIGIVQQNVFLFDSTVRENIMFGRPNATEEEMREAARHAHILDFVEALDDGFDAVVGEQGVKLSGGQKQRISMARAFLKNPPVLIFDEATSSLDSESETLIQQSMEELCSGRTTVVIAHRLSTVRNADYTYVLKNGRIMEEGRHDDLIAKGGYYSDLYSRNRL